MNRMALAFLLPLGALCLAFLLGASVPAYWLDIGPGESTKIRFNLPTRIASGVGMEFGHSDSSIQGDSGTIWIKTRDSINNGTQRIGLISDHDGFSGVGVFDSINNWQLWSSERPNGPEAGDTIPGVAHFFMLAGPNPTDPPEFWVAYQDDAGVERRAKLGVFTGTQ